LNDLIGARGLVGIGSGLKICAGEAE
jgi:hypothetical protein